MVLHVQVNIQDLYTGAVLEESKALAESKALEEARFEEELAMAKSESRQNCGRKASPSNLSSASSSNEDVLGNATRRSYVESQARKLER